MTELFLTDEHKNRYLHESIRVNHAGERAAKNIYSAQIKFTKNPKTKKLLEHMLEQELVHLDYFENQLRERRVRPSLLLPLWDVMSYSLGAVTAIMGKEAAMMCTESVEDVIDQHYESQLDILEDKDLKDKIEQFREEELEHKQTATENDAHLSPAYSLLSNVIKFGCSAAIKLSKKL